MGQLQLPADEPQPVIALLMEALHALDLLPPSKLVIRRGAQPCIGCHSVDGTGASQLRDRLLPQYLDWAAQPPQLRLTT
jgi:hypothetical protein